MLIDAIFARSASQLIFFLAQFVQEACACAQSRDCRECATEMSRLVGRERTGGAAQSSGSDDDSES